jgi:hypothetical protein
MIFLGLSVAISSVGFDYMFGNETELFKVLSTFGLLEILLSVITTIGVFVAWRLAHSSLGFDVFLRGTAYFFGVTAILNMVEAFIFLGAVSAFHSEFLSDAKLAVWSTMMNPREIASDSFPGNNLDWIFWLTIIIGNLTYLCSVWWRSYCILSRLNWRHSIWAFLNYLSFCSLVFGLLLSFTFRRAAHN